MNEILTDGEDGDIYFKVAIFDDEMLAEVVAKDTELSDQTNDIFIPAKAAATAAAIAAEDGSEEETLQLALIELYDTKIARNTAWRATLGVVATVIGEITDHRAE